MRNNLNGRPILATFFAVAICIVSVNVEAEDQAVSGVVVGLSGQASLTNPGLSPEPADVGDEVSIGALIETGSDGRIKLYFDGDIVVTCGPSTRMIISSSLIGGPSQGRPGVLQLFFGTIRVLVGKIFGVEREINIETPNGAAGVTGTTLIIRAIPETGSIYLVLEGEMKVFGEDVETASVLLTAPLYTFVEPGMPPAEPAVPPNELLDDLLESTELNCSPEAGDHPGSAQLPAGGAPSVFAVAGTQGSAWLLGAAADLPGAGGDDVWVDTLAPGSDEDEDEGDDDSDDSSDVDVVIDFPE